jgi:hypothetical protein
MEVSGQLYVPAALPPGKEPLVSIKSKNGLSAARLIIPNIIIIIIRRRRRRRRKVFKNRRRSVILATGYRLEDRVRGFGSRQGLGIFLFSTGSERIWSPPSLLSSG